MNQEHRLAEAHPGDVDYRRPTHPPPLPSATPCTYGAACYRRNPSHFLNFTHPDPSKYLLIKQFEKMFNFFKIKR